MPKSKYITPLVRITPPEYTAWLHMRARCSNPNHPQWKHYGGRGISVCDRWLHSFENFLLDMGSRPSRKHSLDRINNNGNYEPDNCRWATSKEQACNKRTNTRLTFQGRTQLISEWAVEFGLRPNVLRGRLEGGWSAERALTMPVKVIASVKHTARIIEWKGKRQNASDWAKEIGIRAPTLNKRFRLGWTIAKALTTPVASQ